MLRWGQSRYAKESISPSHKIGYVLIIKVIVLYLGKQAEYLSRSMVIKRIFFVAGSWPARVITEVAMPSAADRHSLVTDVAAGIWINAFQA